jgi:ribonuclease HI
MTYDVVIWTDGSNDKAGHGGAAAVCIARSGKMHIETYGQMTEATNQKMELMGAIIGLKRCWWNADPKASALKRSRKRVLIYSDSAYLTNCFIQGWIPNWRRKGWRNGEGNPVANQELWETLDALVSLYKEVKFVHVKGHAGNKNNELADQHAGLARISMVGRDENAKRLVAEGRADELAPDARSQASSRPRKRRASGRRRRS